MKTSTAVCRSFIDECIDQHNIGQLNNSTASMAKVWIKMPQNVYEWRIYSKIHTQRVRSQYTIFIFQYWATDLENKVATECLQLHGGWGYMMDTCIARSFIDARVQSIYGGSNEVMKELIARPIVKPVNWKTCSWSQNTHYQSLYNMMSVDLERSFEK